MTQNDLTLTLAADAYVKTMAGTEDGKAGGYYPYWHGWALHDAFVAGALAAQALLRGNNERPATGENSAPPGKPA